MYGGYNLGPDYGAMLNRMLEQDRQLGERIRQSEQNVVQEAMQNPVCQAAYQQHLAAGGRMPYPNFAYQCAATGGFTPDGIQRFQQSEAANRAREMQALQGLRQAEQNRGAAQQNYTEGYFRNQQEAGNVLRGNGTWFDPTVGQVVLPYLQPGVPQYDANTGQTYVMDPYGNYFARTAAGYWYQITPAR
jgi:hypothetical protein